MGTFHQRLTGRPAVKASTLGAFFPSGGSSAVVGAQGKRKKSQNKKVDIAIDRLKLKLK